MKSSTNSGKTEDFDSKTLMSRMSHSVLTNDHSGVKPNCDASNVEELVQQSNRNSEVKRSRDEERNQETTKRMRADHLLVSPMKQYEDNDQENQARPSPVHGWPQRSPAGEAFNRCHIAGSSNESPSTPSSASDLREDHDDVAYALFTESFETISACASTMIATTQRSQVSSERLPSPRQPQDSPFHEGRIVSLFLQKKRKGDQYLETSPETADVAELVDDRKISQQGDDRAFDSKCRDGKRNQNNHDDHNNQHNQCSPRSPPQRVVKIDGDDHGCGDISPIKFSPPLENSYNDDSHRTSHASNSFHDSKLIPYKDRQYDVDDSSLSGYIRKKDIAEVSFDTSGGSVSYHQDVKKNTVVTNRKSKKHLDSTSLKFESKSPSSYDQDSSYPEKTENNDGGLRRQESEASLKTSQFHDEQNGRLFHPFNPKGLMVSRNDFTPQSRQQGPTRYSSEDSDLGRGDIFVQQHFFEQPPPTPFLLSHDPPYSHYRQDYFHFTRGRGRGRGRGSDTYESDQLDVLKPYQRGGSPSRFSQDGFHFHHTSQNGGYVSGVHYHEKQRESKLLANGTKQDKTLTLDQHVRYRPYQRPLIPPFHPQYQRFDRDAFHLLRSIRTVFQDCTYLLDPARMGTQWNYDHEDPIDLKIAKRRIESAICALGGYIRRGCNGENSPRETQLSDPNAFVMSDQPSRINSSIFRDRNSSRKGRYTHGSVGRKSSSYTNNFHKRYFVGCNGISWEVEEDPPVPVLHQEARQSVKHRRETKQSAGTGILGKENMCRLVDSNSRTLSTASKDYTSSSGNKECDTNQKMKYRCKLCNQPKHNHICPYKKSLVRSIGVMVVPHVTAYEYSEPGILTSSLSKMNNFVSYRHETSDIGMDLSSRDQSSNGYYLIPSTILKPSPQGYSHGNPSPSASTLSTSSHISNANNLSSVPLHGFNPFRNPCKEWQESSCTTNTTSATSLSLRPEQYRTVTPRIPHKNRSASKQADDNGDEEGENALYDFPNVPLTYPGRKRLSDTLFYISQQLPPAMSDIAFLLRRARELDDWDLAVAEVLTQVLVCTYCSEADYQLKGLRNYLLNIGIAS